MLVVSLHGKSIPVCEADTRETVWFGGQANQLSKNIIVHPLIDRIHSATKRYVHFEAGAIGHRLYLAAEAFGLSATGIGAFYDDEVNRHLNLISEQGQVVYHFAIGYPVPDPRLSASN
jgi:nitroreductase